MRDLTLGNMGAELLLSTISKEYLAWHKITVFRALRDNEVRGVAIWSIFEYACGRSMEDFVKLMIYLHGEAITIDEVYSAVNGELELDLSGFRL